MSTIVIDPGHGGNSSVGGSSPNNATGPKGTLEKNLTLIVALETAQILNRQGYIVILTRTGDTNLGLRDRAQVAAINNATVFVSIHFNADDNPEVQGTETWVHPAATRNSKLIAASIQQRLLQATGYRDRGIKSNDWGVLDPAVHDLSTAVCLAEISFMTDPEDEIRLLTDAYQSELAHAIAKAITDYYNNSSSLVLREPEPSETPAYGSDL